MATNDQVSYQINRQIPTADGSGVPYNLDRFGNLGTFGWKTDLVKMGFVWRFSTGIIVATGADLVGSVGGGNGTSIDEDQPDFIVSNTSADWVMIPFDGRIRGVTLDLDADGEYAAAAWATDLTQGYSSVTGTAMAGRNLLGMVGNLGPRSLPSTITSGSVITSDITDPVLSDMLELDRIQAADTGTAASNKSDRLGCAFNFEYPYIMYGPSTILGYWGGTAAVAAVASLTVAIVPTSYFRQ